MEHRLASRRPVDVEVVVEIGATRVCVGRVRDVSLSGVFVEVFGVEVGADVPVRLTFVLPDAPSSRSHRWHGYVVRSAQNGIGLIFESEEAVDLAGHEALLQFSGLVRHLP